MELQMRVLGGMGSMKARGSFGSYLGRLLPCWVIWNRTRSSRRIAKGFQVCDFAQAVVT